MLHEEGENGVSITSQLILRHEGHLDCWPLLWSPRAPSLPCCFSVLNESAWEALVALGSCLVFPWSHLTPVQLPASFHLAAFAAPARTSLAWKDLILWHKVSQSPLYLVILTRPRWYLWHLPLANIPLPFLCQSQTRQAQPYQGVGSPLSFALLRMAFAAVYMLSIW